ncbi:uncharacterized protein LOC114266732 [Camellia sinensis]|uniref:uncharacterized protein LOC114266732 n=1 Tax=Camellia sinensis TaxID=4442 RepID=UPI001035BD1B|nr:uncharacterized protein LOC114266732 [Camellia sinensis]XP_028063454.1 uncharacterized protein LOC114266732 [Camellia sinensis]
MNPPNSLCTGIIFHKSTKLRFVRCGRFLLWATKQRRLRGQIYQIYYRIRRANSGIFNQYTHSVTGDNYSTPTDLTSRNVKKFRIKGFEYFQEIAEIVENCCATGALSRASTQGPLDSEEEDDMLNKFRTLMLVGVTLVGVMLLRPFLLTYSGMSIWIQQRAKVTRAALQLARLAVIVPKNHGQVGLMLCAQLLHPMYKPKQDIHVHEKMRLRL